MSDEIPLCRPSISEDEIKAVGDVLRSGWLAHGPFNHKFEELFAKTLRVPHAISMNSCTSALEVALKVAGIKGEVIVPSMTWVATANVVLTTGGTPVFCEVDPATRNVTTETIAACITPKTEAVIVVHFGGQPCAMDDIVALCEKHKLFLIEDSAETLGATWRGRQAGSFTVGCFSFFPTKNITTGEGGMLTCRDGDFAKKARALIAHGVSSTTLAREKVQKPWLRAAEVPGHNFRMPNPLAVLGLSQLQKLDTMNERRTAVAEKYRALLANLPVKLPKVLDGATHVYQMFTIEVAETIRDQVVNAMRADHIGASVHFDPPVHLQPLYEAHGWKLGDLPETEGLSRRLITLPMFPDMTDGEVKRVADSLANALGR
jgi:perosamine synthetase